MKNRNLKNLFLFLCFFLSSEAIAALDYTDADFSAVDDSASTANEFNATFDVLVGGNKVADGEIIANNFTGAFVGDGLAFNVAIANSVNPGGRLLRLRMDAGANPPGKDPVSTADVAFNIIPVAGFSSAGISLSSWTSTLAVDNINNLTFTGTTATIQDDESAVNLINGAGVLPVAFSSGSNINFIVGNWNGPSGFSSAIHREKWSVDVVNGESTNFTFVTGRPGTIARETLVWGVEIKPLVDMKITKSVDDASPNYGDTVTFTLSIENIGVNDANDVLVTDIVPSGFSYVAGSISGANSRNDNSPSGSGLSWVIDNFIVGDPAVSVSFDAVVIPP